MSTKPSLPVDPEELPKLLAALKAGKWGEDLAAAAGVSLPTLNRRIAALRALGVQLRSSRPHPGYVVEDWGIFNPRKFTNKTESENA
jgi:predicted DNA-binding transcriptional regulator YafY